MILLRTEYYGEDNRAASPLGGIAMKKITKALTAMLLLSALLTGCAKSDPETPADSTTATAEPSGTTNRVWDGSVASRFSGGSGTAEDPYRIRSAAELAYLAETVNSGKETYSGKTVALAQDIDLNQIEWTPIGDGNTFFEGTFEGQGHTIRNLKISQKRESRIHYSAANKTQTNSYTGLFGSCKNASFSDLSVRSASIAIPDAESFNLICSGILVGFAKADNQTTCRFENIRISDADISLQPGGEAPAGDSEALLGGIVGMWFSEHGASLRLERVESEAELSCTGAVQSCNQLGGIIGSAGGIGLSLTCTNFRSDLTVNLAESIRDRAPAGAFGYLSSAHLTLENGYCVTKLDKTYGYFQLENAVIGESNLSQSTIRLKNLFGRVFPKNENSLLDSPTVTPRDEEATRNSFYSLYRITVRTDLGGSLIEENCLACDALPDSHAFPSDIWNLSDPAHPRLK